MMMKPESRINESINSEASLMEAEKKGHHYSPEISDNIGADTASEQYQSSEENKEEMDFVALLGKKNTHQIHCANCNSKVSQVALRRMNGKNEIPSSYSLSGEVLLENCLSEDEEVMMKTAIYCDNCKFDVADVVFQSEKHGILQAMEILCRLPQTIGSIIGCIFLLNRKRTATHTAFKQPGQSNEEVIKLEIEELASKKNTYEIYCANCSSMVTKVALRRRKDATVVEESPSEAQAKQIAIYCDNCGSNVPKLFLQRKIPSSLVVKGAFGTPLLIIKAAAIAHLLLSKQRGGMICAAVIVATAVAYQLLPKKPFSIHRSARKSAHQLPSNLEQQLDESVKAPKTADQLPSNLKPQYLKEIVEVVPDEVEKCAEDVTQDESELMNEFNRGVRQVPLPPPKGPRPDKPADRLSHMKLNS